MVTQITATVPGNPVYTGAGTNYFVQTPTGVLYIVYVDPAFDVKFVKSTDGGVTWSAATTIFTGTTVALSVWYDRWSNISTGLIHVAYTESVTDDVLYRTINTESSDSLTAERTIFAGGTTGTTGCLSIARARGGDVYCAFSIDGVGAESGFKKLASADILTGGAWSAALATPMEDADNDQIILLPGWGADNQDMMLFFWDASADEISRKCYDQSGDTWATIAEASISGSMADVLSSSTYPHWAASVDITNSQNLLVAWNAVDGASADLLGWTVTESAITAFAVAGGAVVSNGTDDQGFAAIGIDTNTQDWYVWYGGKSDGTETFSTSLNIYEKVSTDDGATWAAEVQKTVSTSSMQGMWCCPRFATDRAIMFFNPAGDDRIEILVNVPVSSASSGIVVG